MIPKIIHFCWLSNDPYPALIEKCLESWRKYLPDYEIKRWDASCFNKINSNWVRQAFQQRKYAFAADFIRLYALTTEGGIYLDSDIEVVRPFDPLLNLPYFIGRDSQNKIEAAVIGAQKGTAWIKECLGHYHNRDFCNNGGGLDMRPLPGVLENCIRSNNREIIDLNPTDSGNISFNNKNAVYLLPFDYFCCKRHDNGKICTSGETFSIHHFASSWYSPSQKMASAAKRATANIFGRNFAEKCSSFIKSFLANKH